MTGNSLLSSKWKVVPNAGFPGGISLVRRYHAKPKFYLLLAGLLVIGFSISYLVANSRLSAASDALASKIAQRDEIVQEIGELEKEIAFAQTDEYVERAARDELGLIMPGEIRYVSSGA
ncbi:MAG TPA: septum formation initiator family protein [Candidatus Pullichristensenella excrementigallinarum]|uniref:Septum formation initiator family protein n=1 Tax=Candidatus Pullichristensenella excrementigallinarum TaxID=2840907 RepID=A0A9D1IDT0_9FIRM|nr:septum formation initiator family protein [Candidatus Pullichristensenella excrementigallinarum]